MKPHPDSVAAVIARSDERDLYLQRILTAERDGYARGRAEGYAAGYLAAVAELKRAQQDTYALLRERAPLWAAHARTLPAGTTP